MPRFGLAPFNLAVRNIFGSNAFNMGAFFFVGMADRSGPLFNAVSDAHVMTALWSMLLTGCGKTISAQQNYDG